MSKHDRVLKKDGRALNDINLLMLDVYVSLGLFNIVYLLINGITYQFCYW